MDVNIPMLISEERSMGIFFLVTVFLGGGAAWLTGRAIALTWRPWWQLLVYAALLGGAVRFLHHALFGGTLLSAQFLLVDTVVCLASALAAFWVTRAGQMATQYAFINVRKGLLGWRRRAPDETPQAADSG